MHIQNSATKLTAQRHLSLSIALRLRSFLQGLLGAIVVLCLPPGAGMMLIALAAAAIWRLAMYVSAMSQTTFSFAKSGTRARYRGH